MKETKIKTSSLLLKTSSLLLTLKPGNKILASLKTQNKRGAGFNNNFAFDDCSHELPEFSVPGN